MGTCWLLAACGGKKFVGGDGDGAGGAGGDGTAGSLGGSQGGTNGGAAGGAGLAGNAGSAGGGQTGCSCAPGSYCRDGSTDCYSCSELSRVRFRTPERLSTLSDSAGARFPRVGGTRTDLLYQLTGVGLRYTTDSSTSAGSNIALTLPGDAAPLLLSSSVTTLGNEAKAFNFVFDRTVGELRQLYFGQWDDGLQSIQPAPAPFNDVAMHSYGLALTQADAPATPPRAYWMTKAPTPLEQESAPTLWTALVSADADKVEAPLSIGDGECPASPGDELVPWVTPDGSALLFSHERLNEDCGNANQKLDLYTAFITPANGLPAPGAAPLDDVNSADNDLDPSFSSDFCELYFASDRDGDYSLYRARRR